MNLHFSTRNERGSNLVEEENMIVSLNVPLCRFRATKAPLLNNLPGAFDAIERVRDVRDV